MHAWTPAFHLFGPVTCLGGPTWALPYPIITPRGQAG